ncbi:hypothetical protein SDC9_13755 [bioreactor metagenome]|uniref:Uncharacterized protein n=1 Tax=bioreactor metagenome TaxID=1076179 RepID=A0A644TP35_9ZZZZ
MIFNYPNLIFDFIKAKIVVADGIVDNPYNIFYISDFILDLIKTKYTVGKNVVDIDNFVLNCLKSEAAIGYNVFNQENFIFNFVKSEGVVGNEGCLIFDLANLVLNLVQAKDIIC